MFSKFLPCIKMKNIHLKSLHLLGFISLCCEAQNESLLRGESGKKRDRNIALPALTKADRNLFYLQAARGAKRAQNASECIWGCLRNQPWTLSCVMPYQPCQSGGFGTALWIHQDSFPPSSKMPADNGKHLYIPELQQFYWITHLNKDSNSNHSKFLAKYICINRRH